MTGQSEKIGELSEVRGVRVFFSLGEKQEAGGRKFDSKNL